MRALLLCGAALVLLGGLGIARAAGAQLDPFDLDSDYAVPAFVSAAVIAVAAVLALRLRGDASGRERAAATGLAMLFCVMVGDELLRLHERLELRTDVDWQLLYAPVAAAGGVAWLVLLRRARELSAGFVALAAGAACWCVAQALELFTYGGGVRPGWLEPERISEAEFSAARESLRYNIMMVPEELLELTGSLLFCVALVALAPALRQRAHARFASPDAAGDRIPRPVGTQADR